MPRGGARPGAGRKPKAIKYAGPVAAAEDRLADKLPGIVDRLIELCHGVVVQDENPKTGELNVYSTPPDRQAIEYAMNRIMGKPTERVEVDADVTTDGPPVEVHLPPEMLQQVRAALVGRPADPTGSA